MEKHLFLSAVLYGDINMLNELISDETECPVDLAVLSSITDRHVSVMKQIIKQLDLFIINEDFINKQNLLYLIKSSPEVALVFENHLIAKSNRYGNFYSLVRYANAYANADIKRIFKELLKNRNKSFHARIALDRINATPGMQKYLSMH